MKITYLTSALVALLGLALIGAPVTLKAQTTNAAPAMDTATTAPAPATTTKHKSAKTTYEGSITAIDAGSLTVATTKQTLTLAITPTTHFAFIVGKKKHVKATAADFGVGDHVTGSYTKDDTGALTAFSVHKKKTTAAAAPATPATPAAQ